MSHLKLRKEKNCLNCNAQLIDRYCHICGQENIEPKESVGHLLGHYVEDVTHFDGKFFLSLKYLIFRPGFLSMEYIKGRRAAYLNPIRMYVFTSAFFFLFLFLMSGHEKAENKPDTSKNIQTNLDTSGIQKYHSRQQYDSLVEKGIVKDGWFRRKYIEKEFDIREKYQGNKAQFFENLREEFLHELPKIIFVSLPFFALLLKLFYRRNRELYYVDHIIFSFHQYTFIFFFFFAFMAMNAMFDFFHSHIPGFLVFFMLLGLFYYLYKALRVFYHQNRLKTILKYILISIIFFFVILAIFTLFSIFIIYKI